MQPTYDFTWAEVSKKAWGDRGWAARGEGRKRRLRLGVGE